jgi:ATP/maltotriose-dependent transcriptional regulator MalT
MGSVPRVELLERQSATASLHDAPVDLRTAAPLGSAGRRVQLDGAVLTTLLDAEAPDRARILHHADRCHAAAVLARGPAAARAAAATGRTERQLDVTPLAEGLSNPEIAERRVPSVRTVDHRVSAILTKLGVSSRRDATRHAP